MSDRKIRGLERKAISGDVNAAYELYVLQKRLNKRPKIKESEGSQEFLLQNLLQFLPENISIATLPVDENYPSNEQINQADFVFHEGTGIRISTNATGGIHLNTIEMDDNLDSYHMYLKGKQILSFAYFNYYSQDYHGMKIEDPGWYPIIYEEGRLHNLMAVRNGGTHYHDHFPRDSYEYIFFHDFYVNIIENWLLSNQEFYKESVLRNVNSVLKYKDKKLLKLQEEISELQNDISELVVKELKMRDF